MITSEKEYDKAMRKMILRVQSGESLNFLEMNVEDREILRDCIDRGFVNGTNEHGRTQDFAPCPIVYNSFIPFKGVAFLRPAPDWKFLIPTAISIIALIVSIFF